MNPVAGPIASLGMYDLPPLRAATDALWGTIRDHMRATGPEPMPDELDRSRPLDDIWCDPALVLAQTCGLPLITTLRDRVRLVATPCYDLPGCDGPFYRSFIVVAAASLFETLADLRDGTAAINDRNSQSGYNALRNAIADLADATPFFRAITITGSHQASLEAIAAGTADVAAIDCVTHGLLALHDPSLIARTRILTQTDFTPGLPLITAATTPDATIARLIAAVQAATPVPALHLTGIARLCLGDYGKVAHHASFFHQYRQGKSSGFTRRQVRTISIGPR